MSFINTALLRVKKSFDVPSLLREIRDLEKANIDVKNSNDLLITEVERLKVKLNESVYKAGRLKYTNDYLNSHKTDYTKENHKQVKLINQLESDLKQAKYKISELKSKIAIINNNARSFKTEALQAQELIPHPMDIDIKVFHGEDYIDLFESARLLNIQVPAMRTLIDKSKPYKIKDTRYFGKKPFYLLDDIKAIAATRYSEKSIFYAPRQEVEILDFDYTKIEVE